MVRLLSSTYFCSKACHLLLGSRGPPPPPPPLENLANTKEHFCMRNSCFIHHKVCRTEQKQVISWYYSVLSCCTAALEIVATSAMLCSAGFHCLWRAPAALAPVLIMPRTASSNSVSSCASTWSVSSRDCSKSHQTRD